jgi:hypothetical protein
VRRDILRKKLEFVCILLGLMVWGAQPSHAYQQEMTKLATELGGRIQAAGHTRVTVVDFVDLDGKPNKLGKFLAQQLQLALTEPERKLIVIDQSHLPQLFDQMKLLSEGLIDPETGRKLGKIAGTEVLVVGTVMPSSMTIRVDARAIDLQMASMIVGKSANLARMGILSKLANESAEDKPEMAFESEEDDSTSRASKTSAGKAPRPPARSRRDQGMFFELDGCSLNGDALTCSVTVTSERDQWFSFSFSSRAWTEEGEEFEPSEGIIANSRSSRSCILKQVLKGVPMRTALTFPQFGSDESMVERLRLFWKDEDNCYDGGYRPIEFEKIALSEDADFSSSRTSVGSGKGSGSAVSGKGKGRTGLFGRLTEKAVGILEDAATKAIDKQTQKLLGDDEEEEEEQDPPQE